MSYAYEYEHYGPDEKAEELAELQARIAALEAVEPESDESDDDDDPYAEGWAKYHEDKAAEEEPTFDVIAAADEYLAADRATRAVIWAGLSDDERTAMALGGITGPRQAPDDEEDFDFVGPDDPDFARTMRDAASTTKMGVAYINSGDLDVSEELGERIVELADIAEMLPDGHPTRTEALQTAAAMVENAIAEAKAAVPFGATGIRQTEGGTDAFGRPYTKETDYRGQVRTTIHTPEEVAEAERAYNADHGERPGHRPWGMHPEAVTIEELAAFDYPTFKRFEREHRGVVDALLAGSSVALQLDS